eukprot:GHVU01221140.1.p1 GENE.GHVU01221140.1~~GHVU01221140.1.p1  ORF type:complete len:229 (+),score=17.79 GHVU01221140.1:313-999(+)
MACYRDPWGVVLCLACWILLFFSWNYLDNHLLVSWAVLSRTPTEEGPTWGLTRRVVRHGLLVFHLLALSSHFMAVFADPGFCSNLQKTAPSKVKLVRHCKECGFQWKPPRAHHCRVCQRCVFRMDHHCPWISNCIGSRNQKYFILFLLYTVISCVLGMTLTVCGAICWPYWQARPARGLTAKSIAVIAEWLFFTYVCQDLGREQWEAITANSTLIESYRLAEGKQVRN